jgi:HK97 family phage major capsid protein
MQTEGSAKLENAVTFTTASEKVQTIAHWQPCTRQVLDDFSELANFISDSLLYYLGLREEAEFLFGSGNDPDLHGLATQAASFNTGLLTGAWTRIDVIAAAIEQINIAKEVDPTFVVLNPTDLWRLRRTKDSQGRYLMGDPASVGRPRLWDLDLIGTNNMSAGLFLVGSSNPEATIIRDRMEAQIEVSNSHDTFFVQNKIAVRAEKRCALVTRRPSSFVLGSFSVSP